MPKPKKARKHVVEQHPLYEDMLDYAKSGCSPDWILRVLQHQHAAELEAGTLPPLPERTTLYRWRKERLPATNILPPRLLDKKLGQLERQVDQMKQLQQLYSVAEDRVVRATEIEEKMTMPFPGVDKAIETLLKIAEQLWRVGQDLGLYPRGPGGALAMGVRGADGSAAFAILQVGDGPSRMIDLRNPDLSGLSEPEMQAVEGLLAGQEHGPGRDT